MISKKYVTAPNMGIQGYGFSKPAGLRTGVIVPKITPEEYRAFQANKLKELQKK